MVNGLTNKDISKEMQCSISKIEKHMTAMFKKVEVDKREDLIAWWKIHLQDNPSKNQRDQYKTESKDEKAEQTDDKVSIEGKASITPVTIEVEDIMDLLEQGMTTEEIASETQSTKTNITKQLKDLFKRANVSNKTDLIRWWREGENYMIDKDENNA